MAEIPDRNIRQAFARKKLLREVDSFIRSFQYIFNGFYSYRLKLATFFAGKGLSIENAERIMIHYNHGLFSRDDDKKLKKILCVMSYVLRQENRSRYFFYSMRFGAVF